MQRGTFLIKWFPTLFISVAILAGVGVVGRSDSDRVRVDFSKRIDLSRSQKPQPGTALNVAIASMISPNETIVHYQALLEYLAANVGRKINLVQRKTYVEINGLLGSGGIDLAFICSGPYASGRDRYRFEALAVPVIHQKAVYRAYLITSQDSPIMQLDDLRGKMFAFSDPDSNAGCIVPRFLLALKGERPESFFGKIIFTYSHDNSILGGGLRGAGEQRRHVRARELGEPGLPGGLADEVEHPQGLHRVAEIGVAAAQLARHYDLPCRGTGGNTDSKVNDMQAGYESSTTLMMAALAGMNFIYDAAGSLEGSLTMSMEKIVMDNELCGMISRTLTGIDVSEETLAVDDILRAGPSASHLGAPFTMKRFRSELFVPALLDRRSRDSPGAKTIWLSAPQLKPNGD